MDDIPLLFNQTLESLRRIGARGGKAHARNWRARQKAALSGPPPCVPVHRLPVETTAEAIAALDAQYPWLRGAERRANTR